MSKPASATNPKRTRSFSRPFNAHNQSNSVSSSASSFTSPGPDSVTILVGPTQHRFKLNKRLLCSSSPFFDTHINQKHTHSTKPSGTFSTSSSASLASSFSTAAAALSTTGAATSTSKPKKPVSLWLPSESPTVFALFAQWLHSQAIFQWYLEDELVASKPDPKRWKKLHWTLVRLHLFASHLDLHHLQDLAMDAIQDFYGNCDWELGPDLVHFLYTQCDPVYSIRLRRWAVAMVAHAFACSASASVSSIPNPNPDPTPTPSSSSTLPSDRTSTVPAASDSAVPSFSAASVTKSYPAMRALFATIEEFATDYKIHRHKMHQAGLRVRLKDPRVRILANKLRNDERTHGFRECSFHSHRATVGENKCLHKSKWTMDLENCHLSMAVGVAIAEEGAVHAGRGGLGVPSWRTIKADPLTKQPVKLVDVSPRQATSGTPVDEGEEVCPVEEEKEVVVQEHDDDESNVNYSIGGRDQPERFVKVEDPEEKFCEEGYTQGSNKQEEEKMRKMEAPDILGDLAWPLFSRGLEKDVCLEERALKHMRSISSVIV